MIDIETLSTKPNALILTIAAIKFHPTRDYPGSSFYRKIDMQSCIDLGLDIDDNTVLWWKNQHPETQFEAIKSDGRVDIRKALNELSEYLRDAKYIWANSPSFDCVILKTAYEICGIELPWKFWNERDCRTLYNLANITKQDMPNKKAHNALADCEAQIIGVKKAYKRLKIY